MLSNTVHPGISCVIHVCRKRLRAIAKTAVRGGAGFAIVLESQGLLFLNKILHVLTFVLRGENPGGYTESFVLQVCTILCCSSAAVV